MLIKIFSSVNIEKLEQEVNEFILKESIKVVNIFQSECEDYFTITILYEPIS
jgi:hypothetical protein